MPIFAPTTGLSASTPLGLGVAAVGTATSAAKGDHVHSGLSKMGVLWSLIGANMNTTADQAMTQGFAFTNHVIDDILVTNASVDFTLLLAVGGFYSAASKGGVAIVANTQIFTGLTGASIVFKPTLAVTTMRANTAMYLSLTTAAGSAAMADIYVRGVALS